MRAERFAAIARTRSAYAFAFSVVDVSGPLRDEPGERDAVFCAGGRSALESVAGGVFLPDGGESPARFFASGPPNTEKVVLAGADRGAAGPFREASKDGTRFSPSSGKAPGVAGAEGAPSRSSAKTDDESDEPNPLRSANERVRDDRADRTGDDRVAADPLGDAAEDAKGDDREARDARVGDANDFSGESVPYSLSESSGIGPSRASRRARSASARAAATAASAAARWASAARSARSASSARRIAGSEPPSAFEETSRVFGGDSRAASKLTRSERDARDEPPADRGACGVRGGVSLREGDAFFSRRVASRRVGVDARDSSRDSSRADGSSIADAGRFFADAARAFSRRS